MTDHALLGPWVRRFLLEHLVAERNRAPNTQRSYRDTLRLLLPFAARSARKGIDRLRVEDLSASRVRAFLGERTEKRGCGEATRNQRLAAIRSLAHCVGLRNPEHVQWCAAIRSILFKKAPRPLVTYLEKAEMDALLAAPALGTSQGRRDHALLLFLSNTGARADEVAHVRVVDLDLGRMPERDPSSVLIHGKGNKLRRCPLWARTVTELLPLVSGREPAEPVFRNRRHQPLTRFGVHALVERYAGGGGDDALGGEEARQPAHDPAHDGDAPAARRGGHQHDPCLAGACLPGDDQRVRGGRSGDEGEGPGQL